MIPNWSVYLGQGFEPPPVPRRVPLLLDYVRLYRELDGRRAPSDEGVRILPWPESPSGSFGFIVSVGFPNI